MKQKILVTATPPTTNGDLHLGHLSGPYLGADVYTRAQRMLGHEVLYISSTDDNQSYLMTKALQEKRTTMEVIEDYSGRISKSLRGAQIEMDAFTSPLNDAHISRVQDFFLKLYHEGKLEARVTPTCYCESCQRFLYEAYVKGGCPTCGKSAGGQFCEECGHPNDPLQLADAKCSLCGTVPVIRELKGIWFPIEPYRKELEKYYNEKASKWRPHLAAFFQEILTYEELPAFLISNPSDWGIRVPLEDFDDQVINVWFEMLPGHIQTTVAVNNLDEAKVNKWWKSGEDVSLVQFFGFDNSIYYVIYHTAMMIAHGEYQLADTFINNEFYLLEHKKFSTSRKHAIWGSEFFNETNSDWLRYHLCLTGPELTQTNFSVEEFQQTLQGETLQNCRRLCELAFAAMGKDRTVQAQPSAEVQAWLERYNAAFINHYSTYRFSLRQAAEALAAYVREGHDFINSMQSNAEDAHAILRGLSLFSLPVTPSFGKSLYQLLYGRDASIRWDIYPETMPEIDLSMMAPVLERFPQVLLENR